MDITFDTDLTIVALTAQEEGFINYPGSVLERVVKLEPRGESVKLLTGASTNERRLIIPTQLNKAFLHFAASNPVETLLQTALRKTLDRR